MQVVCDGQEIDLPHEVEGILVINIPSYMGGVALWAHSSGSCMSASPQPQSFSDGMVEVSEPCMWCFVYNFVICCGWWARSSGSCVSARHNCQSVSDGRG